jgi:hypothetical protein
MTANILEYFGPVGTLLGGMAAMAVVIIPMFGYLIRFIKKSKEEIMQVNTYSTQQKVKEWMLGLIAPLDPNHYFTLKICFPGGFSMSIPMVPDRAVIIGENLQMRLIDTDANETTLSLVCKGFGHLKEHFHPDACECIYVKKGVMTCLTTGHIYREGDTWRIPPGETHGATFQDFIGIVTHRPPLPLAILQPVDLDDMIKIFPNQTP